MNDYINIKKTGIIKGLMEANKTIKQIDTLMTKIGQHGPLSPSVLKRINYKFRLDWNYYSNRMEGGTLTRQETRSVMVGNVTVGGKPISDVMEMLGHDEVVREILKIGKGNVRISEKRIKQVHKTIIQKTEVDDINNQIGDWKKLPNEIINYKGEKIHFTEPTDVPFEIDELLNQTNAQLDAFFNAKKESLHPLKIATDFHLGFVSIHPFYDGNGRCARIFMNLILIACGYPPIIINDAHKEAYYQTLADIQVYGGNKDVLYELMANLLLQSVQLIQDAIGGKNIEDDDDLDKRLKRLENQLVVDNNVAVKITLDKLNKVEFYSNAIKPILKELKLKYIRLKGLFVASEILVNLSDEEFSFKDINDALEGIKVFLNTTQTMLKSISITFRHKQFIKAGLKAFNVEWRLYFSFEDVKYRVETHFNTEPISYENLYHHHLDENTIKIFAEDYLRSSLDRIEEYVESIKNKSS